MQHLLLAITLLVTGIAQATSAFYADVTEGVWYEEHVQGMLEGGYLDRAQTHFRPDAHATRAEMVKLIVEINGGVLNTSSSDPVFDDVPVTAWYHPYFEEAKYEKWILGDNQCVLADDEICNARPEAVLTRAEGIALIVRSFGLEKNNGTVPFKDVPEDSWFADEIQIAADNCVIEAGGFTEYVEPYNSPRGLAYPNRLMNRAEMVVMLWRLDQSLSGFGPACETR